MNTIEEEIYALEKKIQELPKGTLVMKKINGKEQPYLQQTINGKTVSTYIKVTGREKILDDISLRNELMKKLNEMRNKVDYHQTYDNRNNTSDLEFSMSVITGNDLKNYAENVRKYKTRKCYSRIKDYLNGDIYNKVFILYGLRRTGKTTLIWQTVLNMDEDMRAKTAFIQVGNKDTLSLLNKTLIKLRKNGFKYIFIDEVTILEDFISGAALLSDVFASGGMKIVLSGTDSLGFWMSEDDQLYDRCILCHTTFIPYYEFENVLGISGIDNYICYGGTMSLEGKHYNRENIYQNKKTIDEYVDSAIANNIQHSLKYYEGGNHFRHLLELYENGELTSTINRVVEDENHRFTIDVLTKDFISHDIGISANNLRKDKNNPNDILDNIDINAFTKNLKCALEILNRNEQKVEIKEIHRREIEEYLNALDLIQYIDIETIPTSDEKESLTVISQPGLRYSQAKLLILELLKDKQFDMVSLEEKNYVKERILNEIKGRMMEEIILLETSLARKTDHVFKLYFSRGEFDMVVSNPEAGLCSIYEIKHSDKIIPEQYKNLMDNEKCARTEFKYGKIVSKYVIYRGKSLKLDNGIEYLNVEEYLKKISE